MEHTNIFDFLYDNYKINQEFPLKLIEFFAGYGSQALALKYLGVKFEHYKICEWAVNSIIAYASLHRNELEEYGNDFCGDLAKEQIASELYSMGVSIDYNKPATFEQLKRMNENKLRLCFNSIMWSNNLVDISRVKGNDLHIENTEKFTYLCSYSFPCQDLSLAGKGLGMEKGSGTRSGLLWEVERILSECKNKPQVLLMENVTQVHGADNEIHFKKWLLKLEEMGYQNYWEDMTAVDYGIPQTRNRTFMISIQGDYNYKFPKRTPLKLRLKDMLENNVDEKYYLSEKMINYISSQNEKWTGNNNGAYINKDVASTLNTAEGNRRCDANNFISNDLPNNFDISKYNSKQNGFIEKGTGQHQSNTVYDVEFSSPCLNASDSKEPKLIQINTDGCNDKFLIKNATKKGYLEATEGDGIDISSRMESHRGTVQKNKAQTLTTAGGAERGVVVKENIPKVNKIGNYSPSGHNASAIVDVGGVAPTVMENHGTITAIIEENESKQR